MLKLPPTLKLRRTGRRIYDNLILLRLKATQDKLIFGWPLISRSWEIPKMPKYELMYILSSAVSDNDVPALGAEVDKFITENDGSILSQEFLGKKKLAYPIKKTRNGFYVVQTFNLPSNKLQDLDNKLRSLESIIRYMTVNVEEMERRKVKDQKIQEKMRANRKPPKAEVVPLEPEIKLTESELEQKIEQALESEDLTK